MEALKRKWNSRRGASILIALLFLLMCMMVGATVVMAAASNAGKTESNKEEQQKYLTLSSALTLLCDELQSVEYVGKYEYKRELVETEYIYAPTADGRLIIIGTRYFYKHTYTQKQGELRCKTGDKKTWVLNYVLPFYENLDSIVKKKFVEIPEQTVTTRVGSNEYKDTYIYTSTIISPAESSYILELTVEAKDDDNDYGDYFKNVQITARLRKDNYIILTAELVDDPFYKMEAVLAWDRNPENLKAPDKNKKSGGEIGPVSWTLESISKVGKSSTTGGGSGG